MVVLACPFVDVEHGFSLVELLPLFGGEFLFFNLDAVFLCQPFQCLYIGELFDFHDEMNGIASFATGKAFADAFGG